MSNFKISDYVDVDSLDGTELFLVSKNGAYRKTTLDEIRNLAADIANTELAELVGKAANAHDVKNILNTINTNLENQADSITQINSSLSDIEQKQGDTTQLNTTDKTSVVNAIKEVKTQSNTNQANISTNTSNISANTNNINTQKSRIDNLVQTSGGSFYQKCLSTDTGALLIVSSGATTGQINLASVTPVATGYTATAGDYVRLVYGVASGSAELVDARTPVIGKFNYDTVGTAIREQISSVLNGKSNNIFSSSTSTELSVNLIQNMIVNGSASNKSITFKCRPNTSYEITKNILSAIFAIGTTTEPPVFNSIMLEKVQDITSTKTKLEISTSENANWMIIQFYNTTADASHTKEEVLASINVKEVVTLEDVKTLQEDVAKIKNDTIIVDINGSGDYTKLSDALNYALTKTHTTVIVKAGTYDIYDELGATYFDNFVKENFGLKLGGYNKYIFEPNAKVIFNYTGSNDAVKNWFSPFNTYGAYEITGLHCECSNCRYPLHDDIGVFGTEAEYVSISNCYLSIDNTANTNWQANICIGGGFSKSGAYNVKNAICYGLPVTSLGGISYHNNGDSDAKSQLYIEGCVMLNGNMSVQVVCTGDSLLKSYCVIANNKLKKAPVKTIGTAQDNMELIAFNNTIG